MSNAPSAKQLVLDRLQLGPGSLVRYQDFTGLGVAPGTVAVTLSRLRQAGVVQPVTKGIYRLPLAGRFGPVPASEQQMLQALLLGGRTRNYAAIRPAWRPSTGWG